MSSSFPLAIALSAPSLCSGALSQRHSCDVCAACTILGGTLIQKFSSAESIRSECRPIVKRESRCWSAWRLGSHLREMVHPFVAFHGPFPHILVLRTSNLSCTEVRSNRHCSQSPLCLEGAIVTRLRRVDSFRRGRTTERHRYRDMMLCSFAPKQKQRGQHAPPTDGWCRRSSSLFVAASRGAPQAQARPDRRPPLSVHPAAAERLHPTPVPWRIESRARLQSPYRFSFQRKFTFPQPTITER